ncbi:MAG: lipase [Pseudohongiella sp.]|nr:MAG: lipase [Pseudohongiella sp.]
MGSSFAAGNGVADQLGVCGRSDHNYSNLVAAELGLNLTDVSCSGATTANILDTPQNGAVPQIEAVTSDTALVTITIGGNDISYTSSTFACSGTASSENCAANLDQDGINAALEQLPTDLGTMFDEIKTRAPNAVVVFVAYPRVFPVDAQSCSELSLSADDTRFLAELGQKLEDVFVSVTNDKQVLLADPYVLADGHGPCSSSERWVNGNYVADTGVRYHPTSRGHIEMAQLVLDVLGAN